MWREDEKANGIRKVDIENAQLKVEGQAEATTKVRSATLLRD
jgi:hypothetical protein